MIMAEPASRKVAKEPGEPVRGSVRVQAPPAPAPSLVAAPAPAPVEEIELVIRARKGDLKAYDELVKRYQERIYATVYHMTANHEDANDLAQEAFIKAFQALKSFKGGSSFYTWVYRIAVNKTINFLKQRKNRAQMSLGLCHEGLGQYADAAACYTTAIALWPDHHGGYRARGRPADGGQPRRLRPGHERAAEGRPLGRQPGRRARE